MSWSCPHFEKSFSRKDSMKRHINNRHSNPGHFTPFNAMHYSVYLYGGWDDGIRQDCLGPIAVDTGLLND